MSLSRFFSDAPKEPEAVDKRGARGVVQEEEGEGTAEGKEGGRELLELFWSPPETAPALAGI